MDLRFLQSFVHVVELGSIAAAARHLNLAPASVAQRLRALEIELATPLVMRAGRTVHPTAGGARVLEHAHFLLQGMRELRSAATESGLPAGPLRLGSTPTGLMGFMPPLLRAWTLRHPSTKIYIDPGPTPILYSKVLSEELDMAVLIRPLFPLPKTCDWRTLRTEKLVLVTPADLAVTDVLATVAHEPFICYDRNSIGGKLASDYLRKQGIEPRVRFELDNISAIARLVQEGLGVSVLPDWTVVGPADPGIKRWRLPGLVPHRTVGIVWMRAHPRSALVKAFVELTRDYYNERSEDRAMKNPKRHPVPR